MNEQSISRLIYLFTELLHLMVEYKFITFNRYLEGMLAILYDETISNEQKVEEVRSSYAQIVGRPMGLDDGGFCIEDKEKEHQVNVYFFKILGEIENLLEE